MNLNKLRGAIRKTKGNPSITTQIGSTTLTLQLMKAPLLEELGNRFPDGGETGLEFDAETGVLRSSLTILTHVTLPDDATSEEVAEAFYGLRGGAAEPEDDLLGDDDHIPSYLLSDDDLVSNDDLLV